MKLSLAAIQFLKHGQGEYVHTVAGWQEQRHGAVTILGQWTAALQHYSVMSRSAVEHFMASITSYKQTAALQWGNIAPSPHSHPSLQGQGEYLQMYCWNETSQLQDSTQAKRNLKPSLGNSSLSIKCPIEAIEVLLTVGNNSKSEEVGGTMMMWCSIALWGMQQLISPPIHIILYNPCGLINRSDSSSHCRCLPSVYFIWSTLVPQID